MKTKLFFLLILSACITSCVNSNKPLTDSEKEKVLAEAREFVSIMNKSFEDRNTDKLSEIYDSSLFYTFSRGKIVGHKEMMESLKQSYATAIKFNFSTVDSKFVVLDRTTVLYGDITSGEARYKDSTVVYINPWYGGYVLKKINDAWKVVSDVSYGHTEITRVSSLTPELSQLELYKKNILGTWQYSRNDTIVTSTYKPLGAGAIENFQKVVYKGKVLYEMRSIIGYDIRLNVIVTEQVNTAVGAGWVMAQRFITPTKSETFPLHNINEPHFSRLRYETEYTSPDTRVQKMLVEGKLVRTTTYKKIN